MQIVGQSSTKKIKLGWLQQCTVVWNEQEKRRKHWATRLSIRSFACTAHSWESELLMSENDLVLSHSAMVGWQGFLERGSLGYGYGWWLKCIIEKFPFLAMHSSYVNNKPGVC